MQIWRYEFEGHGDIYCFVFVVVGLRVQTGTRRDEGRRPGPASVWGLEEAMPVP